MGKKINTLLDFDDNIRVATTKFDMDVEKLKMQNLLDKQTHQIMSLRSYLHDNFYAPEVIEAIGTPALDSVIKGRLRLNPDKETNAELIDCLDTNAEIMERKEQFLSSLENPEIAKEWQNLYHNLHKNKIEFEKDLLFYPFEFTVFDAYEINKNQTEMDIIKNFIEPSQEKSEQIQSMPVLLKNDISTVMLFSRINEKTH